MTHSNRERRITNCLLWAWEGCVCLQEQRGRWKGRQQGERCEIKKTMLMCQEHAMEKKSQMQWIHESKREQWSVLASHGTHCKAVYAWFQYLSLLFSLSERDWKTVLTWEEPRLADSSIRLSMNSFTWVSNCLIRSAFKCWKKQWKHRTASLLYIQGGSYEQEQKVCRRWSWKHHIHKITVGVGESGLMWYLKLSRSFCLNCGWS